MTLKNISMTNLTTQAEQDALVMFLALFRYFRMSLWINKSTDFLIELLIQQTIEQLMVKFSLNCKSA